MMDDKKNFFERFGQLGLLIPLLTLLLYTVCYYYELGFFHRLKLPTGLIQVELKNILGFASSMFPLVLVVIFFCWYVIFYKIPSIRKERVLSLKIRRSIFLAVFIVVTVRYFWSEFHFSNLHFEISVIVGGVLFFLFPFLFSSKKSRFDFSETFEDDKADVSEKFGKIAPLIGLFCITFGLTAVIAHQTGWDNANISSFGHPTQHKQGWELLRSYSSYSIYQSNSMVTKLVDIVDSTREHRLLLIDYHGRADTLYFNP
jgi:amino acid transporter